MVDCPAYASRSTDPIRFLLLLLTLTAFSNAAILPFSTDKSLTSATSSIAASLNADHASFEPKSRHGTTTTTSPSPDNHVPPKRREAAAPNDPPNTDPYKWELCCAIEGTWDCNMALTSKCRGDFRFKCELDGALTHRKDSDECSKLCACFEWTEAEGKPPTVPPRHLKGNEADTIPPRDLKKDRAKAKAEKEQAKVMQAASPFDFVDYTRKVPRDEVEKPTFPRDPDTPPVQTPNHSAALVEEDPHTLASKSTARHDQNDAADDQDNSPRAGRLSKRHNYALVCELDGARDAHITRSCASSPRYYSCDRLGGLYKRRYDNYCDQHCACQYMNQTPMFRHGSFRRL